MKRFVVLLFLVINSIALDPFDDQPKILVNDGNLIFESADSKNVQVKLKGNSRFLLNNVDVLSSLHPQNTSMLTPVSSNVLSDIISQVNALRRTVRSQNVRITQLENGGGGTVGGNSSNASTPGDRRRNTMLMRRVRNLEIKVSNLTDRLMIDQCKSYPCQNGGTCFNMFDTFRCECPENWEGPMCNLDVNECARYVGTDLGCQNGATCVNTVGSYECSCTEGWKGKNCNRRKVDCLSVPSSEICVHGTCIADNNKDGFSCVCEQGWRKGNNSQACTQDVDECNEMRPHCSVDPKVMCVNTPGSFVCGQCPAGFTGNGYYCEDIDECQVNNGGCSISPKVDCINTRGSYRCSNCPLGFEGDGKTCTASSISIRPNSYQCIDSSVCNPNALCYQYPNSPIQCICKTGYTGNGFGESGCVVSPIDPCTTLYCRNGGQCVRNGTTAYCNCPPGTTLPLCMREYNYCSPNPCLNNGNCTQVRVGARYRCTCPSGFTGNRCQTPPGCGGVLTDLNGTLKYPVGGNYQHNAKCAWLIKTNITKVLNITFKSIKLEPSNDCRFDWLQIHDGRSAAAHIIGRFCGPQLPKGGNFISTHNTLYFWFRSDNSTSNEGFEFSWESIDPVCGGEFNVTTHGTVASPGSPANYPMNSECEWVLKAPPGKRIQFLFYTLQIESHVNCSYDYLEIHSGDNIETPSLGKFCNSTIPPPLLTPSNVATIHFHSDADSSDAGFQIAYSVVEGIPGCGGIYTATKGDISSPMNIADGKYKHNLLCDYVIRMPLKTRVRIEFLKFDLEESMSCKFDKLEIFEGTDTEGEEFLIGRYCGKQMPPIITSQTNVVSIKFTTDWSASEEGFQLNYKLICGGIYTSESGIISSPNYPNNYEADRNCEYEIIAPQGKIIVLNILDLDIELHSSCEFDFLEIFGGPQADNSTSLGRFCGDFKPGLINTFQSNFNHLLVQFITDASVFGRGFQANYSFVDVQCGGIITDAKDVIKPPMNTDADGFYQSNAKCQWLVYAPKGFIIQINVLNFELEHDSQCKYDFVKIFNNGSGYVDEIGPFCGTNIPKVITIPNNLATILFQSDSSTAKDGFNIGFNFIEASKQCGGNFYLSRGFIRSPGSPQYYSNKECEWVLTVPNGKQIEVKFNYFDVEAHSSCKFDGLEIRNGGTSLAPLLNKFCGDKVPPPFKSMSNQLYFKFYSDSSRAGRGFEIEFDGTSTGCGGLLTSSKGAITSPNYPATYPHNTQCEWRVSVNEGSSIQFVFSDLDFEVHAECKYDYLEIFDGSDASAKSFGKFCSNENHPMHIETSGNHAMIRMNTDDSHAGRGFHIKYSTKCNRTITANIGAIESPNFPEDYGNNIDCAWTIRVSKGNVVNMQFSHFALENDNIYHNETNEHVCKYDYVTIYDLDYESNEKKMQTSKTYCNAAPDIRNSTTDAVVVLFHTDPAVVASGFRLEWYNEGCGGRLTQRYGFLTSPDYPNRYKHDLECIWEIVVDYGYSVKFTVYDLNLEHSTDCQFDSLIVAHDSNFTNQITKICRSINQPLTFVAEGHQVYVKFETDEVTSGKGFNMSYEQIISDCGGEFVAPNGIIKTPQYPTKNYEFNKTCEWNIKTDPLHTLTFQLIDFDLESSTNCSKDYLEIIDPIFNKRLWKGCGQLPNETTTFKSLRNELTLRLVSDNTINAKGFVGNYSINCGGRVVTNDSGEFLYRRTTDEKECFWTIISDDPSKKITLTFTYITLFLMDPEICLSEISVYEGDIDNLGAIRAKFCGGKAPPAIISNGNALTVKMNASLFVAFSEFDIHYSVMDNACGGVYKSMHSEFASPSYPKSSPLNSYCIWKIIASEGNKISLEIKNLNIAESPNCNENYLEVRKNNEKGDIVGVFCGTSIPANLPPSFGYWIKYKTDEISPNDGFLAEYKYNDLTELSGSSGKVQSPVYPKFLTSIYNGAYRIMVKHGSQIRIEFTDFYMFLPDDDDECHSYLKIYNGFDTTAPLINQYCDRIPEPITSESNVLYIQYSNSVSFRSKFSLTWSEVEKNITAIDGSNNKCGENNVITLSLTSHVNLTSPGYPNGYDNLLDCTWTVVSNNPSYIPSITFTNIDLEVIDGCSADYISVLRSQEDGSWLEIEKLCNEDFRERKRYTGTPSLQLKFHSDYNRNESGFYADLELGCGGVFNEPDGIIEYDSTLRIFNFNCMWNITVKRGRKIQFEFLQMNIKNSSGVCSSFVTIRNGRDDESPLLGTGQYCGDVGNSIPQTSSNRAFVKFKSEGYQSSVSFKLRYYEVQYECGGQIKLTSSVPSAIITTPNYPNIPESHIQCTWTLIAPVGQQMRIDFLERFDLMHGSCSKEYLELREGSTSASELIDILCGNRIPDTKYTRSNILRMKFFTDLSEPHNGFKANVSIGSCGGMVRATEDVLGFLTSPKYPGEGAYPSNTTCDYRIVGIPNSIFTINILDIDLAIKSEDSSEENLIEGCHNQKDHVIIYSVLPDLNSTNGEKLIEVAKLCGNLPPKQPIIPTSNEIIIRLKSFPRTDKLYKGFKLSYRASYLECGGNINMDSGIITNRGYPSQKLERGNCNWKITVRRGRKIKLEFLDVDLAVSDDSYMQRIVLFNDFLFASRITSITNSSNPGVLYSTDNTVMISLWIRHPSNNRGFKLQFSSDEPTMCEGDLNQDEGYIYQPVGNLSSYVCNYYRDNLPIIPSAPNTGTIAYYFSKLYVGRVFYSTCSYSYAYIKVLHESGADEDEKNLGRFCGNDTKEATVLSPWPDIKIEAKQSSYSGDVNYTLHYKKHNCGGILRGTNIIRNIPAQNANYKILDCAWSIKYDEGYSAALTINSLNLKLPCDKEFINIYNGPNTMSPLMAKLCGNEFNREPLQSQRASVFVEYHTDDFEGSSKNSIFEIKSESKEFGCGGILHKITKNFKSPLYNIKQYPQNVECIWEIRADDGFHVGINFEGRFFIEQSDNCTKDYLEFYDYVDDNWKLLRRICGRDTPKPVNSTSSRMKVIFRSDDRISGDGFNATWDQNCGGVILVDEKTRILSSPGYPKGYSGRLKCNYTFKASRDEAFVNVRFIDFELEETLGKCIYDSVTIFKRQEYVLHAIEYTKTGSYCGTNKPKAVRYKKEVLVEFKTDLHDHAKGFQIEYNLDTCGGWVKNSSVIQSPTIVRGTDIYDYAGTLKCIWNITAPRDKKIVIKFEKFNFQFSEQCSFDYVQIFNGSVQEDKNSLVRLCHNLTIPPIVIENNEAIILMKTDQVFEYIGFSAIIAFQQKCDEHITLTKQNPIYVIDKSNTLQANNLECIYRITGDPLSVLQVNFNQINLSVCDPDQRPNRTCDCDFLEVFDGNGPFSEKIGRYCGHDVGRSIISTGSSLYIRFVTDGNRPSTGFKMTVTVKESPCGSQSVYNITENSTEPIIINSPKLAGQNSYPPNIRCVWTIQAPFRDLIEVIFSKFNLEDSENCAKDYLKIEDDMVKEYITEGFGESVTYRGNHSYVLTPNFYMGVSSPIGSHIYCGSTSPHEYASQTSKLRIYFSSDSTNEFDGFSVTVRTINACMRNFTALQGRFYSGNQPESCKTTITVPESYTISLYFYRFFFILNDCEKSFMKIYDGDFDNGALLETLCGYSTPNPIFSTGNQLSILTKYENGTGYFNRGSFDILYVASEKSKGRGCGGDIYNYGGYFTSPLYPSSNRTNYDCTWNVTVPQNLRVALRFAVFDMGPKLTCENDYVEIMEENENREFKSIKRYCGEDKPAVFVSSRSQIKIHYVQTVNFAGTGWSINFIAVHEGATPSDW